MLKHSTTTLDGEGVGTRFADGSWFGAHPHATDPHYHVIAHRCGYGDDLWAYAFEHEVAHAFVAEFFDDRPSDVIWRLANGLPSDPALGLREEMLAQTLQRFARANEEPIIADVDWHAMRRGFLALFSEVA